jgi:hypothetical protein
MQRKLTVLKPTVKEITPANISHKIFSDNDELATDQVVHGWSFITPEQEA